MQNDDSILIKRFNELSIRSSVRGIYTYTEFLTLAEQDVLSHLKTDTKITLLGGYPFAERKIARFGALQSYGYEEIIPIVCVKAEPLIQKFADILSHRDVLGALMGLSIRREVLGDIIIHENSAYIFCIEKIADYIIEEFKKIKRTDVICTIIDSPPIVEVSLPAKCEVVISSERLDTIVAAAYKFSRNESQNLFEQKKVFVNNRVCENLTFNPNINDIISVRGYGRFIYEGII